MICTFVRVFFMVLDLRFVRSCCETGPHLFFEAMQFAQSPIHCMSCSRRDKG